MAAASEVKKYEITVGADGKKTAAFSHVDRLDLYIYDCSVGEYNRLVLKAEVDAIAITHVNVCNIHMKDGYKLKKAGPPDVTAKNIYVKIDGRMTKIGDLTVVRAEKIIPIFQIKSWLDLSKIRFNLPVPNHSEFVGHESTLKQIDEHLGGDTVSLCALHGLRGTGKTQIAIKYLHDAGHTHKLWFRAANMNQLLDGYRLFLYVAGLMTFEHSKTSKPKEVIATVKSYLSRLSSCLIVYDDAPSYGEIERCLFTRVSEGGCDILVTSCKNSWPSASSVAVGAMQELEAKALVKKILGDSVEYTEAELTAFVAKLGGLPLALAQASHYLKEAPTYTGINRYLLGCQANRRAVLASDIPSLSEPHDSVWLTYTKSLKEIGELNVESLKLLKQIGWLGQAPVSTSLLLLVYSGGESSASQRISFNEVLGLLVQNSLLKLDKVRRVLTINPVLKEVILTSQKESMEQLGRLSEVLLAMATDYQKTPINKIHMQQLLQHAERMYAAAETPDRYTQICGDEAAHKNYALFLLNYAKCFHVLGHYEKEQFLLKQALMVQQSRYPEDHVAAGMVVTPMGAAAAAAASPAADAAAGDSVMKTYS